MVSHKNYNLNANEAFLIIFTSRLITCFIDGFTLKMKSQSIAYLLNEGEDIYWILDLESEVHSIWDFWISGLQKCRGSGFFEQASKHQFPVWSKKIKFYGRVVPLPESNSQLI